MQCTYEKHIHLTFTYKHSSFKEKIGILEQKFCEDLPCHFQPLEMRTMVKSKVYGWDFYLPLLRSQRRNEPILFKTHSRLPLLLLLAVCYCQCHIYLSDQFLKTEVLHAAFSPLVYMKTMSLK